MENKKELPPIGKLERALHAVRMNVKDPVIKKMLEDDTPSIALEEFMDRCKLALAVDDKLSEDGMELLAHTLQLVYINGVATGEKKGLKEALKMADTHVEKVKEAAKSSVKKEEPKSNKGLIVKIFGKRGK